MSAIVIEIASSPKLRGRPLGGWGYFIDANGAETWRCRTADGSEASIRFFHLLESHWWAHMSARERAAFHCENSKRLNADAARDYRAYVEHMDWKCSQHQAGDAPAKDKTPSGANR